MKKQTKQIAVRQNVIKFRNRSLSKNSIKTYSLAVNQFQTFCNENGADENIDSIKRWLKSWKNAKTHNLKYQALKEFYYKIFDNIDPVKQLELRKGFESVKRKIPNTEITTNYMTIDQVETLTDIMNEKMNLIVWALFWTGARISELLDIELLDIELNGVVTIRIKSGKGGKERECFLPKDLYNKIRIVWHGSKQYLFETRNHSQYDYKNITNAIRKISKGQFSAHSLRHSKAMHLKNVMALSPDQVAKALGHKSVVTTLQNYFHGTPNAEQQGIK